MGAGAVATPPAGATPPAATPPATPPANTPAAAPENEGGAGSKSAVLAELADERRKRQALEAEHEALKSKTQTEAEKAIDAARKEGKTEAETAANLRIAKSEAKAAMTGKVGDVDYALFKLGDLDRFIVKGEVDSKAISTAIEELVKANPTMAPAGGRAKPLPGGGATLSSGLSLNDDIRRRAGRG